MKASCSNTWIVSSPFASLKAEVPTDSSMIFDTQKEFLPKAGFLGTNPLQSNDLEGEKRSANDVFFKCLRLSKFDPRTIEEGP